MIVVSQNLLKYGVEIPKDAILRFNLAWQKDITRSNTYAILMKYYKYKILLDIPIGRRKPPNYEHEIQDVVNLVNDCSNIEYVAISNIENYSQVMFYQSKFKGSKIVPKIESYIGLRNVKEIIRALNYEDKVLMLDHQDLYSDLARMGVESDYLGLVDALEEGCKNAGVHLLKSIGIVFSDGEEL